MSLKAKKWYTEVKQFAERDPLIIICGNKADKSEERQIPEEEGKAYANSVGCRHFSTSAKTGLNVEEMFKYVAQGNFDPFSMPPRFTRTLVEIHVAQSKQKKEVNPRRLKISRESALPREPKADEKCSC